MSAVNEHVKDVTDFGRGVIAGIMMAIHILETSEMLTGIPNKAIVLALRAHLPSEDRGSNEVAP